MATAITDDQESTWRRRYVRALHSRLAPLRLRDDETLFFEQSGPHHVTVTKEGDHVLLWLLDRHAAESGVVQSELNLADPLQLVDPYTQAALLSLLWSPNPQRIYTTGLGGGCLPTVLHYHLPRARIDCVELDPAVIRAATACFGFRTDSHLHLALDDGRAWLTNTVADLPYDLLILDAFLDHGYAPYAMATYEFAQLCAQRLTSDGVVVVNLLYLDEFYRERIRSFASVFDHIYLLRMGEDNDLLFAAHRPLPDLPVRQAGAHTLATRLAVCFPLAKLADKLMPLPLADLPGIEQAQILRDAAPPDTYFAAMPALDEDTVHWPTEHACPCGSGRAYGACHGRHTA